MKLSPQFPKQAPLLKFTQTLIHEDIERSNNSINLGNISPWNPNKRTTDLLKEVEEFFKVSPPVHSPELEKLFTSTVKINKSIDRLKNFDFKGFYFNLDPYAQRALQNGDYACLKQCQEYKNVEVLMLELADSLNMMKAKVESQSSELIGLKENSQEVIDNYRKQVQIMEDLKGQYGDMSLRYDSENVKKFLQNQVNDLMIKKETIKNQMIECDSDDLATLQEDYLKTSKKFTTYLAILEKAFAY